jgi:hypothetical protein
VVDHRRHPRKQLGVIAVGGRDHSLGQRAAGEAAMFDRSGFLAPALICTNAPRPDLWAASTFDF